MVFQKGCALAPHSFLGLMSLPFPKTAPPGAYIAYEIIPLRTPLQARESAGSLKSEDGAGLEEGGVSRVCVGCGSLWAC